MKNEGNPSDSDPFRGDEEARLASELINEAVRSLYPHMTAEELEASKQATADWQILNGSSMTESPVYADQLPYRYCKGHEHRRGW